MAFRPKTLTASVVPIFVGTALSIAVNGQFSSLVLCCALLSALCIQVATNLFNDAIDFKKGADTDLRLGPQRFTQSLSYRKVFQLALVVSFAALLFGIPLVMRGGWPFVVLGLVSLFLAFSYTGGPFPLAYLGLGDLFVILFFGLVAVAGTYFLHQGTWSGASAVAGIQIGFLATLLIAINNMRDAEQDKKVGKKTLAVRLGPRGSALEVVSLVAVTYLLQAYWYFQNYYSAALVPLITLPFGVRLIHQVLKTPPGKIYNQFLGQAAFLHLTFGFLLGLGLWLKSSQ